MATARGKQTKKNFRNQEPKNPQRRERIPNQSAKKHKRHKNPSYNSNAQEHKEKGAQRKKIPVKLKAYFAYCT
jgi:hypothetical protein